MRLTIHQIINTSVLTALLLTVSGCSDTPVSCQDPKFKKIAQQTYLQTTMKKLSKTLIEQIGTYSEQDKKIAIERFKNNTFMKNFYITDVQELSKDEENNSAECQAVMEFDTYEGTFSYDIKYGIQLQGSKTILNMISQ